MLKAVVVAGLVASTLACGSAQAGDRLGAVLGGVAVGAVGGAIIGSALSANARPVYAPAPVYLEPAPPPPRLRPVVVVDRYESEADILHDHCDAGDRRSCIKFGILIGQHREHVAQWRRSHPDFFSYEN